MFTVFKVITLEYRFMLNKSFPFKLSIIHYPLSIVHCSLFIIHYSLFIIHYSLFIIHYSLFIIHCSLFIVHCSLFIVHCSLFIVHCSFVLYKFIISAQIIISLLIIFTRKYSCNQTKYKTTNMCPPRHATLFVDIKTKRSYS
jgi:hypothetical protein